MPFQQSAIRLTSAINKAGSVPVTTVHSPFHSTEKYSNNRQSNPGLTLGYSRQYSTSVLPRAFEYILGQPPSMPAHFLPSPKARNLKYTKNFKMNTFKVHPISTPGYFCKQALPSSNVISPKDPNTTKTPKSKSIIFQDTTDKPKRVRRKHQQIDRNYQCLHKNCAKAYGTLNHLNQHVVRKHDGNRLKSKNSLYTTEQEMDVGTIELEPQPVQKIQVANQNSTLVIRHNSLPKVSMIDIKNIIN